VSAVAVTIFLGGGEIGGLVGYVMVDKLHLPDALYVLVTILLFFGKILAVLWRLCGSGGHSRGTDMIN